VTLARRVQRLEAGAVGRAPVAVLIYADGVAIVHLTDTGEQLPREGFRQHWPGAPTLKAYGDPRMVDPLGADWSDAPPPRSSADC
jgi:hypothetical protein